MRRRDVQPGAGHRHGCGGPGGAGRGAAERGVRAAAGGARGAPGRRGVAGDRLPQVPGRPRLLRRGGRADDVGWDRVHALPAQPAGRAGPARGGDGRARPVDRGRPGRGGTAGSPVRRAARHRTARSARHAVRSLPVRGVRRAAGADHLGPGDGRAARPPGRAAAGGHLRRHDPGPRPVHRHHARRGGRPRVAGRRAGRGDGLRVAGRRHVPARHVELAGRGHHARPGDRHSRARGAGPDAVLEGRVDRAAAGAGPGGRGVRP